MEARVQLSLNVENIDEAVEYYAKVFGVNPHKRREGYANFVVNNPPLKLVLEENPGQGGSLNHWGYEVDSTDSVASEQERVTGAGLAVRTEMGETCCFATQDKFWLDGTPDGVKFEVYTVLADSDTRYGDAPTEAITPEDETGCCTPTTCCDN